MTLAFVRTIDRSNQRCSLQFPTTPGFAPPVPVTATYNAQAIPFPLARVDASQTGNGTWQCGPPVGDQTIVFTDDFMTVSPTVAVGSTNVAMQCDTAWTGNAEFGDNGSIAQDPSTGLGVVNISSPDTLSSSSADLSKDVGALTAPDANTFYYCAIRMQPSAAPTNLGELATTVIGGTVSLGVWNGSGIGSTSLYTLVADTGGGSLNQTFVQATAVSPVTMRWLHLMVGQTYAAGWVDADGPYLITSIGTTLWSTSPGVALNTGSASALSVRSYGGLWDYVQLRKVNAAGVVDPRPYIGTAA